MDPLRSAETINSVFINQIKGYAIFATDTNGIITAWNKGAERLKGYSEEEIVGRFYGILHPYGLFMVKRIMDNADGKIEVESEEGAGSEFKVYFKSGM